MASALPFTILEQTRLRVVAKVRELRTGRNWTQAELAAHLGLSQARLSEIERGGGSFSAEQLLEVLRLFNVSVDAFLPPQDPEDELQNALARLGAIELRELPDVLPSARVAEVISVARETLLAPRSPRLLLALAPVLIKNLDAVNLDVLHAELAGLGFPARVPWLVDNVAAALLQVGVGKGRPAAARWHRARLVLGHFLARHPAPVQGATPPACFDHLDANIRSERTLAKALEASSGISRRWGVVTELHPEHFADALRASNAAV